MRWKFFVGGAVYSTAPHNPIEVPRNGEATIGQIYTLLFLDRF